MLEKVALTLAPSAPPRLAHPGASQVIVFCTVRIEDSQSELMNPVDWICHPMARFDTIIVLIVT